MEGWSQLWSRARRDVIPSQMLPKRFWHVLWVDHLLSKHTGSVLTQSEGVREDWWMTSSWLEFGILQALSSTLIFHLVHKMASFDHCVILVKGGGVIEGQLLALVWNLLLLFWCPAMIHDDQLHVHVERRLTRKTHPNYFCLILGSIRMVRYKGYTTSR